jgi:hypothetical protein
LSENQYLAENLKLRKLSIHQFLLITPELASIVGSGGLGALEGGAMFLFFTNTFGSIEPASIDVGGSISDHPGIRTRNQPFFASAKSPLRALFLKSVVNDQNMGDRYEVGVGGASFVAEYRRRGSCVSARRRLFAAR